MMHGSNDRYFTAEFAQFVVDPGTVNWTPPLSYYSKLVTRLVQGWLYLLSYTPLPLSLYIGLQPFSSASPAFTCDWHFCEFSSSLTFTLYTCCVELMALPLPSNTVSRQLLMALYDK